MIFFGVESAFFAIELHTSIFGVAMEFCLKQIKSHPNQGTNTGTFFSDNK